MKSVQSSLNSTTQSISKLLLTYINGTDNIIREIDALCNKAEQGEAAINSLVSFRILEYVGKRIAKDKDINTLDDIELASTYPVERDWSNQKITYLYNVSLSNKDIEKINKATQMRIQIKK